MERKIDKLKGQNSYQQCRENDTKVPDANLHLKGPDGEETGDEYYADDGGEKNVCKRCALLVKDDIEALSVE